MKQEKLNDLMPTDESKVVKYEDGFSWQDTIKKIYKDEPGSWRGVTRTSLIGGTDEVPAPFHLRYFEVEAGGFSSHEKHAHQHIVVVIRGQGSVTFGDRREAVSFGDVVYIAPWEVHQFHNPDGPEPFGFLCMVPADRDRPVLIEKGG